MAHRCVTLAVCVCPACFSDRPTRRACVLTLYVLFGVAMGALLAYLGEVHYDFTLAGSLWVGSAVLSCVVVMLLPRQPPHPTG